MFGPGWYQNWLSQGPLVKAANGPTLSGPGKTAVPGLTFAHAAGHFGEGASIPCFYIDTFDPTGNSVPPAAGLSGDQWYCQRYGLPFGGSNRPPDPVLPIHGGYPNYAIQHPIIWDSDVTDPSEYEIEYGPNDILTGYGRSGSCTLTLGSLGLDGDYAFGFFRPGTITLRNTATGKTVAYPSLRRLYPAIPGIYDAPYAPMLKTAGSRGPDDASPLFGSNAFGPYVEGMTPYEYNGTSSLLRGPNPPPIIRVLVGATFTAAFAYPTFIDYRTGKPTPPIAAAVQISLQPDVSDDALTVRRTFYDTNKKASVTQDEPTYVNADFATDILAPSPYYPYTPAPGFLRLYPALKYYEPFAFDPSYYQGAGRGTREAAAYSASVSPNSLGYISRNSNTQVFGDIGTSFSRGLIALSSFPPTSTGTSGNVYPHDADIATTITPATHGPFGTANAGTVLSLSRWIWNGPIHITGHLSDHDAAGSTPPTTTDTDASDKGALDQDPATGRVYLAKVLSGQIQIAAREGWQGLGGTPARDYAPLLGPDGAALAGKSPHLASRTAGGDAARGGLTTLVYQDAGGHVVLAMSEDGLHSVGVPTMPIFTETGGLPCHLHDESTGLTYVAAAFAVAPPATAPAGTVSTTEDLRLARLGANNVPLAWADGKLEKVIKLADPKAGRPSLTQNRMDPEQPLLLIHGDKKYLGTMGGETWTELTT